MTTPARHVPPVILSPALWLRMPRKTLVCMGLFAAATITGPLAAQSTPSVKQAQSKTCKPPKTAWGDPDLSGLWPGSVNIPLQRPATMGTRSTLTEQEFAARDAAEKKRVADGHWIEYYPASYQASLVVDPPDGRIPPMTTEATAPRACDAPPVDAGARAARRRRRVPRWR